jgi:SAM-dependent methyltransferase
MTVRHQRQLRRWGFVDALDPGASLELGALAERMHAFYAKLAGDAYWGAADSANETWSPRIHPYHCDLRARMKEGEHVVDFGCGGTHAFANLKSVGVRYTGLEWSSDQVAKNRALEPNASYVAGDLTASDFGLRESADWAISLFALEHCTFPDRMLRRMSECLKPDGQIGIVCPDFTLGMPSLRSGFRPSTRRDKLKRLQWVDLVWAIAEDKLLWPRRLRAVHESSIRLPIYLRPRCLEAPYYCDNDAVFLATEGGIVEYLRGIGIEVTARSSRLSIPDAHDLSFCYVIGRKIR